MHHLIIGYGYCGYHLARQLLEHRQEVTAISRHLDESMRLAGLNHLVYDISEPMRWQKEDTVLYYLIPPTADEQHDRLLQRFLANNSMQPVKVIYFGSSGVYGDHQGAWIDEQSPCHLDNSKQLRRLSAEHQWLNFCKQQAIDCVLLRVAGIYGPNRLPIQAATAQTPLIEPKAAPYTNHIYVKDLSNIAYQFAIRAKVGGLFNVADGVPKLMGALQQQVAKELSLEPAAYESWEQAWERASPMKREFMQASKRLRIDALEITLKQSLHLTPFADAIRESLEGS